MLKDEIRIRLEHVAKHIKILEGQVCGEYHDDVRAIALEVNYILKEIRRELLTDKNV